MISDSTLLKADFLPTCRRRIVVAIAFAIAVSAVVVPIIPDQPPAKFLSPGTPRHGIARCGGW